MEEFGHIGKYKVLEEIGRGSFAVVYRARDTELDRVVALKVLHPYLTADPSFATFFHQEMRAAARLQHPNIATVYETGEAEGQLHTTLYIAMEYLPGRTLRALLEAEGALSLERALPILKQIAEALDRALAQGVIHRDVRPGNVMVEETERGVRTTLMDFGLMKAMEQSAALASQDKLLGSPEYVAPEQADPQRAAEIGPAADRYALGIIAYQMLTGRVPFPGSTPATLDAHTHEPVPPPRSLRPDLTEPVAAVLVKMLSKAPADRFASARAFAVRLQEAMLAESQMPMREAQLTPLYKWLQAAAAEEDWTEVMALGKRMQALDASYRDVSQWVTQARKQLRRPQRGRMLAWALGGLAVPVLVVGLVIAIGGLRASSAPTPMPTSSPTPTAIPTRTPTHIPTKTPTRTPTPTATATPQLTSTPTPIPTDTPTPMPTAVPVKPTLLEPTAGTTIDNVPVFRWQGKLRPGQFFVVQLHHRPSGRTLESEPLTTSCWASILAVEQSGEWIWQVRVVQGSTILAQSEEWHFWFVPFHSYPLPTPRPCGE